ncbi:IspD/TarI family cytidylyltransferase [Parvibacter caecicola]|uniref:Ribitol-5-phosphate cytidylyltransferase n=1 Tax=Parvibacter caecicola TaxID=747645 RepID=A0A4T9TEU8_9ACTN|nr:2-C-methyl-D-erythritol 4-phosphate cytidylyltransferase [Parvibacter caecicola]TJW11337.1 2-C-methyl-D-erythritol 4-phosphate cytidylyltransferase [Parvibacter caecicola]
MHYAAILAGGSGVRMGNPDKPKQFFFVGEKPILVHTVEKFCVSGSFEKVLVLCPATWVQQTRDLLQRFCPEFVSQIAVIQGGETRNGTILNSLKYLEQNGLLDDDAIVVTHDAVRPFVNLRIIEDNIAAALKTGACDTVVPATDTIVESLDGDAISAIPDRHFLYQGQTPQSFNGRKLKEVLESLSDEEKAVLTDACKAFVLRGLPVQLVRGDASNIKITYPQDLRVAETMLGE